MVSLGLCVLGRHTQRQSDLPIASCHMRTCGLRHIWLFVTPQAVARGSSIHGGFQATILEWVAISSSRALPNSGIKPGSLVSPAAAGRILHHWATWEGLISYLVHVSNTTEEQWGSPRLQGILVCPSALRSLFFPFLVLLFPFHFGFFLLFFLFFESDSLLEEAVSTYFLRILI